MRETSWRLGPGRCTERHVRSRFHRAGQPSVNTSSYFRSSGFHYVLLGVEKARSVSCADGKACLACGASQSSLSESSRTSGRICTHQRVKTDHIRIGESIIHECLTLMKPAASLTCQVRSSVVWPLRKFTVRALSSPKAPNTIRTPKFRRGYENLRHPGNPIAS